MILSPDDHRSLQAIDGELATCEPHLAAMFAIFSRLNADEAPPPSEDLIVAASPPAADQADTKPRQGWRGRRRSQAARARLSAQARARSRPGARGRAGQRGQRRGPRGAWRPVAAIAVPALLLVTVLMVVYFGLTAGLKCRPAPAGGPAAARSSAQLTAGGTGRAGCTPTTGAVRTAANGNP
jgi:hypothetical protein